MDWSQPWVPWFTFFAGIASFVSVGLTIPTLIAALSTKKAFKKHDDKRDFKNEIGQTIKDLENIRQSIRTDNVYNKAVLDEISDYTYIITIRYETVIEPFKDKINTLNDYTEEALKRINNDSTYNQDKVQRSLFTVIEHLKKERDRI